MKAREKILKTADKLFYENGIKSVGVDTIVSEAGIAKATLYNHFPSKNALIIGYLESMNCKFSDEQDKDTLTIIDTFEKFLDQIDGQGTVHCPFISAMSEFPHEDDEIRKYAVETKKKVFEFFKYLAEKENLNNPETVASQLSLIKNGAVIQKQIFGNSFSRDEVMELVKTVIQSHQK